MLWNNMKIAERKEQLWFWEGSENLSMLHISDIHLWYSTKLLSQLARIIANHDPGLIILTGDYYDIPTGARNFRMFLQDIVKRYPVVFILGNHDKFYGSRVTSLLFGIPNCTCVDNDVFQYKSKQGKSYTITSWQNRHQLQRNSEGVNIVLMHDPGKIREKELVNIDLILAGHLHGGQFVLFKTKDNSHFPGNLFYKYCCDRKQLGSTTLIVSRGLGDSFPFRWNCPKEVIRITIE